MSVVEGGPATSNLVQRVQNILLKPAAEWEVIAGESATPQSLFTSYACILAAIPAIAHMIGGFIPFCIFGVCVHYNPIFVIVGAVVNYFLSLVGVYVIGLVIDALAPSFGGEKNPIQSMKVAVYSFTAAWLAGVFAILPALAPLTIVGLYSFYLLYVGLPILTKAPKDKALGYTAVAIVCGILVFIVAGAVSGAVTNIGAGPRALSVGSAGSTIEPAAMVGTLARS